jgi:hypothetical protein
LEDTATPITLTYGDSGADAATACTVTNVTGGTVGACTCASGVCTVTFTPTPNLAGAAVGGFDYTVTAGGQTSDGVHVTVNLTAVNDAPTVIAPNNRAYPLDGVDEPIPQGTSYTLTPVVNDVDAGDTYTVACTVETVGLSTSDTAYVAPGTQCGLLPSLQAVSGVTRVGVVSFSSATGVLTWTPTRFQKGTYKFTLTVRDAAGLSASAASFITVREAFTPTHLLLGLDAAFAEIGSGLSGAPASCPRLDLGSLDTLNPWLGYAPSSPLNGTISGFASSAPWSGLGTAASPYTLGLNGSTDRMQFSGAALSGQTRTAASAWVSGSSVASGGTILQQPAATNDGLVIRQSDTVPGKIEISVGAKPTYSSVVLSDSPTGYWRLGDSGSTALDSSPSGNSGAFQNSPTTGTAGLLNGPGTSTSFSSASTQYVRIPDAANLNFGTNSLTIEGWVKPTNVNQITSIAAKRAASSVQYSLFFSSGTSTGNFSDVVNGKRLCLFLYGSPTYRTACTQGNVVDGGIHHVMGVADSAAGTLALYVDGLLVPVDLYSSGAWPSVSTGGTNLNIGASTDGAYNRYDGSIQEVALYDYALNRVQAAAHYLAGQGKFYPNPILAAQPKGYWRLGETAGGTAFDSSSFGNHSTFSQSGLTFGQSGAVSGDPDKALKFDGLTGSVSIPSSPSIAIATQAFTLSAWVKSPTGTGGSYSVVLGKSDAVTQHVNYLVQFDGGGSRLLFLAANGSTAGAAVASSVMAADTWTHLAATYDGTNVRLYLNGVLEGSAALTGNLATTADPLYFGRYSSNYFAAVSLDEVAIFDYLLSAKQLDAIRLSGAFKFCQSSSAFANGDWNLINGLWDGTALSMFVNGKRECQATPSSPSFTSTSNAYAGAAATAAGTYWSGKVSDIKIAATSDNSTNPATAATIATDFEATANRYRVRPVEDIVSNGLVVHLDPANAKRALGPNATGCANLFWKDLSPSGNDAYLANFLPADCAGAPADGWRGTGTSADPYRLDADGVDDGVFLPTVQGDMSGGFTVEWWLNPKSRVDYNQVLYVNTGWGQFECHTTATGAMYCGVNVGQRMTPSQIPAGTLELGVWQHFTFTFDGTLQRFYKNGAQLGPAMGSSAPAIWSSLGFGLHGSLGSLRVYNRGLSLAEVQQNYYAQLPRYTAPDIFAGLKLWLDASQGVTQSGGLVSAWADQSPNAANATQATGGAQPTYVASQFNGRPVIRFAAGKSMIAPDLGLHASDLTVFAVTASKGTGNDGDRGLIHLGAAYPNGYILEQRSFNTSFTIRPGVGSTPAPLEAYFYGWSVDFTPYMFEMVKSLGVSNTAYLNASNQTINSDVATAGPYTAGPTEIGTFGTSGGSFDGDIAELLVYKGALGTTQRQSIESYLRVKYNLY